MSHCIHRTHSLSALFIPGELVVHGDGSMSRDSILVGVHCDGCHENFALKKRFKWAMDVEDWDIDFSTTYPSAADIPIVAEAA